MRNINEKYHEKIRRRKVIDISMRIEKNAYQWEKKYKWEISMINIDDKNNEKIRMRNEELSLSVTFLEHSENINENWE